MIIPFNIEYRPQIESGEYKVLTASGKPARIVCWDMKTQFGDPILALIQEPRGDGFYEYTCTYRADGRYTGNNENYLLLEDGRTPEQRWEDQVLDILRGYCSIKTTADELLKAAQRELNLRVADAIRDGAVIEGTNGEARDDAPKMKSTTTDEPLD